MPDGSADSIIEDIGKELEKLRNNARALQWEIFVKFRVIRYTAKRASALIRIIFECDLM